MYEQKIRDVFIEYEESAVVPKYETPLAAGADLFATEDIVIRPFEKVAVPLNIKFAIPDNLEIQIRARSGLSLRTNLKISNSVGTVDSDSISNISVLLENNYNISNLPYEIANNPEIINDLRENYREITLSEYLKEKGNDIPKINNDNATNILNQSMYIDKKGNPYGTIYIKKGSRIAQMILAKYYKANFIRTEDVSKHKDIDRGGGFGHTGL